jgi:hypothetical protein
LFFPPTNKDHVSYSAVAGKKQKQTETPITAKVMRVASIKDMLGHDRIDAIKMDIEGFEYNVLSDILSTNIRPAMILVEFHHRKYQAREDDTRSAVASLRRSGYRLFYVSSTGREYGFVKQDSLSLGNAT